MTDYAEFLTEIDRLRREIHDACKLGEWKIATYRAADLERTSNELRAHCASLMSWIKPTGG